MSLIDEMSRLLWDGTVLVAQHEGVKVVRRQWPAGLLPGQQVVAMKFTPAIRECEMTASCYAPRQMTRDEMAQAMAFLRRLHAGTHDAMDTFHQGHPQ